VTDVVSAPASGRDLGSGWRAPLVVGVVLLVAGWVIAGGQAVPGWERSAFRAVNDAPGWVARGLWPVMQLGSIVLLPAVVIGVLVVARPRVALAAALAALAAWLLANRAKDIVERGRPVAYLAHVHLHDGDGRGLGFPSGHTSVAFALATVVVVAIPRGWRWAPFVIAALVGIARMSVGVHLPADVIGGAGLGILCGLGARLAVAAIERRRSPDPDARSVP
jgi:undecaprenyl-diphosphatase